MLRGLNGNRGEDPLERTKVVVRYADGKVLKGFTQDFFPHKDRFHLFPVEGPGGKSVEIQLNHLKALFMVRDFAGDSGYRERKKYLEGEKPSGRKVEITFKDGEVLVGSTLGYDRERVGFFLFPVDPRSNNIRVYVIVSSVKDVRRF